MATPKERIKNIQKHLNLEPDGIIGANTLTAIEARLFVEAQTAVLPFDLKVSKKGLKQLVTHEISSEAYYRRALNSPTFPGGYSGVTIGIGYDLGYNSPAQVRRDWQGQISDLSLEKLLVVVGLKGDAAKMALKGVKSVKIDLSAAEQVFYQATLPRYASLTRKAYPGVELLFADAQAGLLSLIFNRGTSMSGSRRQEMKAIQSLVTDKDYVGIANAITAMKRLWEGKGLDGLLKRREDEADLVRSSNRLYQEEELVTI